MNDGAANAILSALRHREQHGRHMHHQNCIHNLPPEEQIAVRGSTPEKWQAWGNAMPTQITPEQWEIEPPEWTNL